MHVVSIYNLRHSTIILNITDLNAARPTNGQLTSSMHVAVEYLGVSWRFIQPSYLHENITLIPQ